MPVGLPAFQEEVRVVVGLLFVLDAEPSGRQPVTCLVPGGIVMVAASLEMLAGWLRLRDRWMPPGYEPNFWNAA